MPIKWTAEVDQVLLLKILETSNINADVKAISEAWPADMEKPTPRAITERLVKIRTTAKSAGTATHFSVKNKPATPAGTPRKRTPAKPANGVKKATPKKNGTPKAGGKASRKRGRDSSDDDGSGVDDFNSNGNDTHESDDEESPSKKVKFDREAFKLEGIELEDAPETYDDFLADPITKFA